MVIFYVLLVVAVALSCLFIFMQNEKQPLLSLFLKGIASIAVLILGLYACYKSGLILWREGILFLIGLLFCLFGDVLLALLEFKTENKYNVINLGSASFFMAHIFFALALILIINNTLAISLCCLFGLLMVAIIYFMQKPMHLDYNKSCSTILIYTFGLSTALALSVANLIVCGFSTFGLILMIGLALFFLSDLVLSVIYFKTESSRKLYYVNYTLYYLAITLIAVSFIAF